MKKAIFIDRDGTIIVEPDIEHNEQVDTLEKLEFVPGAISGLSRLRELDYELVIASNQDGLGTEAFPVEAFNLVNDKMLKTLSGEGVTFDDMLFDEHFPEDNHPCRKPGTGMFGKYLSGAYDLASSFMIGDRLTDIELAFNLGVKGILIMSEEDGRKALEGSKFASSCVLIANDWSKIVEYIRASDRSARIVRKTAETDITLELDLDGKGETQIDTGLKFFDHMLSQIPHHSGVSLKLICKGDLEVDEHHTMEDVGIALGEAILKALGDKRGIERYGFVLPMDEADAMVLMDLGGRIDFNWNVPFTREYVGDTPTEMFKHFFQSLCNASRCNLHVQARGENNHHIIEGVFKAYARALRQAIHRDVFSYQLPSSKGIL